MIYSFAPFVTHTHVLSMGGSDLGPLFLFLRFTPLLGVIFSHKIYIILELVCSHFPCRQREIQQIRESMGVPN
jgi:hypothetical protein